MIERREVLIIKDLEQRPVQKRTSLIYLDGQLIGEMGYQINPQAWNKDEIGRGKGIDYLVMK